MDDIAEFERSRIVERIKASLERAKREGRRLRRPRKTLGPVALTPGMTARQAGRFLENGEISAS